MNETVITAMSVVQLVLLAATICAFVYTVFINPKRQLTDNKMYTAIMLIFMTYSTLFTFIICNYRLHQ